MNELNISCRLSFSKNSVSIERDATINVTVTGTNYVRLNQSIGTSEEAILGITDIGTQGYVFVKNLDSTNYVQIGQTNKLAVKMKAGEIACFRTSGALYAQANTSACEIEALIIED
jgi:hypothetical protein